MSSPPSQCRTSVTRAAFTCGGVIILAIGSTVHAESGILTSPDGLHGHLFDLGNGIQIYSNAHGLNTPIRPRGGTWIDEPITLPNGNVTFGHRIPFGSDTPSFDFTLSPTLEPGLQRTPHRKELTRPMTEPSPQIHLDQLLP